MEAGGVVTFLRRNRIALAGTAALILVGLILFGVSNDLAPLWYYLATVVIIGGGAWVDHHRLIADIRAGRDRLWPR